MTSAQGTAFAAFIVLALAANGLLFAIMRYERREHVDAWLDDGRPGAAWLSVPAMGRESWHARWCLFRWAFATPRWARDDAAARRLLVAWRVSLAAGATAFVVLLALIAF